MLKLGLHHIDEMEKREDTAESTSPFPPISNEGEPD